MLTELVSLEHAIAVIVQRCMSENLSAKGEDSEQAISEVLTALQAMWPIEYERSNSRVKFVPCASGGVQAMFNE